MTSGTNTDDDVTKSRQDAEDTQATTPDHPLDAASTDGPEPVVMSDVEAEAPDGIEDTAIFAQVEDTAVDDAEAEVDAEIEAEAEIEEDVAEEATPKVDDFAEFSSVDNFFATTPEEEDLPYEMASEDTDTQEAAGVFATSYSTYASTEGRDPTSWQKQGSTMPPKAPEKSKKAKPPSTGFFGTHPILPVPPSMPPSASTGLYNFLSYMPWLVLGLILAAQTILTLDARALWFSDEVRHAAVFREFMASGKMFVLYLNGEIYPDKPPLYFWFLRGIYELIRVEGPLLYFGAAAISGLLYVFTTCLLGRFVGRLDGRTILAGGIILLSTGFVMGVTHYARMDLLFSSAILLSHIAFFFAWTKERSLFWSVIAFALAGAACLIKGPLGLALPLATSLLFLLWCGRITRLFRIDVIVGLVACAAVVGGWLAGVFRETGNPDFILTKLLQEQVLQRAVDASHHKEGWNFYLFRLPFLLLPWVGLILCLPYYKILGKHSRTAIMASRKPEAHGLAYLWCMVLSGVLLLSLVSTKILIYLLPILPALALVAGRAMLQLSGFRATLFRFLLTVTMLLAGAVVLAASFMICGMLPVPAFINAPDWSIPANFGFMMAAATMAVTALALWLLLRSSRPEGMLLIMALYAVLVCFPLFVMGAPALDAVMSPKRQSEMIKAYVDKGYYPVTYKVYEGTYTYYSGHKIHSVPTLEALAALQAQHQQIILATRVEKLKDAQVPECFVEVSRQWIESSEYVIFACPPDPTIVMPPKEEPAPFKIFKFGPALPGKLATVSAEESPAPEAAETGVEGAAAPDAQEAVPAPEPATESTAEPATESVTESAAEPATESVTESATEPEATPASESEAAPATEPEAAPAAPEQTGPDTVEDGAAEAQPEAPLVQEVALEEADPAADAAGDSETPEGAAAPVEVAAPEEITEEAGEAAAPADTLEPDTGAPAQETAPEETPIPDTMG